MSALAYFIPWTTYGSWLHGNERGSADPDHNQHDTPYLAHNKPRIEYERSELDHEAVVLDGSMRPIVAQAIANHCKHRLWTLHEIHVRTSHVHVVVSAPCEPEKPLREFKAWATRRLRQAELIDDDTRLWTRHGSTKHLFTEDALFRAVRYVREEQGEPLD